MKDLYNIFKNTEEALTQLLEVVKLTLDENGHLADGEKCTLWRLKKAIGRKD